MNTKIIYMILTLAVLVGCQNSASNNESVKTVKAAYETFAAGDTDGWKALHSEDLTFTVFGDIATSGVHKGPDAVIQDVFNVIPSVWPNFNIEHKHFFTDGDMVFVHSVMTADGLDTETLHMFEVVDGKIVMFKAFDDTHSMHIASVK
tara:strand:- start:955 stop:1398 length:444 start_codon:yes stop_codon:yes gene_type:complete